MEAVRLFLRPHIFLSLANRYVVILDVRRDRYLSVHRRHFDLLAPWLSGWPGANGSEDQPHGPSHGAAAAELAAQFTSRGILTSDSVASKPVCPISIPIAKARCHLDEPLSRRSIAAKAASFFLSCRRADRALRRMPFETIIRNAASWHRAGPDIVTPISMRQAAHAFEIFRTLRLLYPRPYLCTFDSLALLEFMAGCGLHPRWVFGVRADPFYAHCWLQYGEVLLNDSAERVARLAPIMAV
jgi:Transglutaminase-like superfamily